MPLPQIAIVGRPNVGKSSLLNRLAGRRVSIVDPTPGITRDRVGHLVEIDPPSETPRGTPARLAEIVDTGGYGLAVSDRDRFDDVGADLALLTDEIEHQVRLALERARIVLFVIDAQAGITGLDSTVASLLRRGGHRDKVVLIANKVDGDSWEAHALDATALGLGEPVCVSAANGRGVRELSEILYERLGEDAGADAGANAGPDERADATEPEPEIRFAVVGRRNSGKSTLINTLAGEPRVIVSEIAGTTRDAIDVRFEVDGHVWVAIDTAGLRKRKSMKEDVEYYAFRRALAAIHRADVVMLLIDATQDVSQVDQRIAQEVQRLYKPVIIVVNKWDLVDHDRVRTEDYLDYLTQELRGLEFAPIVFLSAKSGEGVRDVVLMAATLHRQAGHREPTSRVNRAVEAALAKRGPSSRLGTQAKVFYASQVSVHPPTLVLVVNKPELFRGRYERYLLNRLRDELPFSEVPIRMIVRPRQRVRLEELKSRGRAGARERDGERGGGRRRERVANRRGRGRKHR